MSVIIARLANLRVVNRPLPMIASRTRLDLPTLPIHGARTLARERSCVFVFGGERVATVLVEFFGIPRARAGVAQVEASGATLGELIQELSARMPGLAECCFEGPRIRTGYTANLRGDQFTTDPETPLNDGDSVLIMSLDAGG